MENWPLLTLVTFLPIFGVAAILLLRGTVEDVARNARWIALWTSGIDLLLSLVIWAEFDPTSAKFQFVEQAAWLPQFKIGYQMGVDGISLFFVVLCAFLTPICVIVTGSVSSVCRVESHPSTCPVKSSPW